MSKANRHRFPGAPKRHRKPMTEPTEEVKELLAPPEQPDLHAKLRIFLAGGPKTFGKVRRELGISPMVLIKDCIDRHPDVYEEIGDFDSHPGIALRSDGPDLSAVLERGPLLEMIAQAGVNGVYLLTLHKKSGLSSKRVEELLSGVNGLERLEKDGRVLYRLEVKRAPDPVAVEPEVLRDRLVGLLGDSRRDLHWLATQMAEQEIALVLAKFAEEFSSEDFGEGRKLIWLKSLAASADSSSALQAPSSPLEPPELLANVIGAEEVETLKFKPAAPGMGARRNGPAHFRGDGHRARRPLVNLTK